MGLRHAVAAGLFLGSVAAVPGLAQQASCAGLGMTVDWIAGDPMQSDIGISEGPILTRGLQAAREGYAAVAFAVARETVIRLEAVPTGGVGDTVLELYDASGTIIVTDDDSGGGLSSRAELSLRPGQYCLAVRGFGGGAVTADLQVSRLEHQALTQGLAGGFAGDFDGPIFVGIDPCGPDTPATPLGAGPIDGMLSQGGVSAMNTTTGAPYYRFTLSSAQSVTIRAENPLADPYIYLFDGAGGLLAENDDYDSLNSRIDVIAPLPAGDYCIGIRALSNPNLPVTVSVAGFDSAAMAREDYAAGWVVPLDGSYPVTDLGLLPPRSVRDVQVTGGQAVWYALDIDDWGMLLVTADEVTDSDPVLTFFDEFGALVAENDDANGTLNSELAARVSPGRYYLAVAQYSSGYAGVIRLGMQRFEPMR